MALLAIGTAVLMTAVAVAIGGLVLEVILFAISRSLAPRAETQVVMHNVISLDTSENSISGMEWAKEVAA
jgi:lipopolysaccharide export LptBFGC system permease protein LptF